LLEAMPTTNQFAACNMGGMWAGGEACPNEPTNIGAETKNANPKVGVFLQLGGPGRNRTSLIRIVNP